MSKNTKPIEWVSKQIPIKDLKQLKNNPRTISEDEFKQLENDHKLGIFKPLILNADNTVLGGNQRLIYYLTTPVEQVWCSVPNRMLEEKEWKEIVLLDNAHRGEFDLDILQREYDDIIESLGLDFTFPTIEPEIDEETIKGTMDDYINNSIKQIILYYQQDEFRDVLSKIEEVMGKIENESIVDNSKLFSYLLNYYARNNN